MGEKLFASAFKTFKLFNFRTRYYTTVAIEWVTHDTGNPRQDFGSYCCFSVSGWHYPADLVSGDGPRGVRQGTVDPGGRPRLLQDGMLYGTI